MVLSKKALLIGCNYVNTNNELNGCINDVKEMKNILMNIFKYEESDIFLLTDYDEKPTRSNIISKLKHLVELSYNLDEIYIHYSGHGKQITDKNGDEPDGKDEGIVPADFNTYGIITDDILYDIFFSQINSSCKTICVFDSCHSGSISDLNYSWLSDGKKYYKTSMTNKSMTNRPNSNFDKKIFVLSGCVDDKLSYETIDTDTNKKCGMLSFKLRKLLEENNWILTIKDLIIGLNLKLNKENQIPVLTVGFNSEPNELVFANPNP
jgi:hypothetical protein